MVFYDMETSDTMPYALFLMFLIVSAGVLPNAVYG
jgi:hypothetical protein